MTLSRKRFTANYGNNSPGFTLVEMLVVVVIILVMGTIVLPGLTSILSGRNESTAKIAIRSALARAQAYAVANQKQAGVRFQFAPPTIASQNGFIPLENWQSQRQYLVIIEKIGNFFYAIADAKPVALSQGIGVFSESFNTNDDLDDETTARDQHDNGGLLDATTFSIVFSSTGQLVAREFRVANRPFIVDPPNNLYFSDTIFNHSGRVHLDPTNTQLLNNLMLRHSALLYCDTDPFDLDPQLRIDNHADYRNWCWTEWSERGFYIFDMKKMASADPAFRFDDYAAGLQPTLVNMYTGGLIEEELK